MAAAWKDAYVKYGGRALASALRDETSYEVRKSEASPLSDEDIRTLCNGATAVKTYPELSAFDTAAQIMKDGRCALLYLTTSDSEGHWTGVLRTPHGVEYFDSYGHAPDEPLTWLTPAKAVKLHELQHHLTRVLRNAARDGTPVTYNKRPFQSRSNRSMATCGRHVACRLLCNDMTLPQYAAMIDDSGMDADEFVTRATDAQLAAHSKT